VNQKPTLACKLILKESKFLNLVLDKTVCARYVHREINGIIQLQTVKMYFDTVGWAKGRATGL